MNRSLDPSTAVCRFVVTGRILRGYPRPMLAVFDVIVGGFGALGLRGSATNAVHTIGDDQWM